MRLAAASALSISALLLLGACAARNARPEHAQAPSSEQAPKASSRYSEMTWAEYYTDVMERARRRGVMVVWINPPPVHRAEGESAEKIDAPMPAPR